MTNTCKAVCFFTVLLMACVPLARSQGTYTQIDVPGSLSTECDGINSAGDIVGTYSDSAGIVRGFLLSGNTYRTIMHPGFRVTVARGINDFGQIAGSAETSTTSIGFVYDIQTQTFTDIKFPRARWTYPTSLNNSGSVVGLFIETGRQRGFEFLGSNYKVIVPPGAANTWVNGIDALGEAVGFAVFPGGGDATNFVFHGKYRILTLGGAPRAYVQGVNSAGNALVGEYAPTGNSSDGFLYQNGALVDLQFPGAQATYGFGVNDAAEVVGTFADSGGLQHGFLWTPPTDAAKK